MGGVSRDESEFARDSNEPPPSIDESHIQAGGPVDVSSFAGVSCKKMGRASFRRSAAALEIASARGDFISFSTDAWALTESILTKSWDASETWAEAPRCAPRSAEAPTWELFSEGAASWRWI